MAADSKGEYSSYLQKFNHEQNDHYYTIIPNIFQVNTARMQQVICSIRFAVAVNFTYDVVARACEPPTHLLQPVNVWLCGAFMRNH